ncbi:MAG: hypothetical protein ACI379_11040 [Nocardioides sp.]|uniref:hypothetical protein n=1 Tax=Nocardioides sp. TaxID=35761 RepID=UPI003F06D0C4
MISGPLARQGRTGRTRRHRLVPAAALALAALVALTGCQSSEPEQSRATEDTMTPSPDETASPGGEPPTTGPFDGFDKLVVSGDAGAEKISLVSHSSAKGQLSGTATRIDDAAALDQFNAQFTKPMRAKVTRAVREHRDGDGLATYVAVVEVGCAPPVGVRIDRAGDELTVRTESSKETISCLVAVTYVLVFAAPPAA